MDWIPIGECDIQTYTATEKEALAILNEGKNYFHIAYRLHVSFEWAREIVFSIRKKESLIMGKLTDQQKAEIYQKWKDGQAPKCKRTICGPRGMTRCMTASRSSSRHMTGNGRKKRNDCIED